MRIREGDLCHGINIPVVKRSLQIMMDPTGSEYGVAKIETFKEMTRITKVSALACFRHDLAVPTLMDRSSYSAKVMPDDEVHLQSIRIVRRETTVHFTVLRPKYCILSQVR